MKRREFIAGAAGFAAAGRLHAGEEGEKKAEAPEAARDVGRTVAPPGCQSVRRFVSKCSACGLCISSCPGKTLRAAGFSAYGLAGLMMPRLDFRAGFCDPECRRCAEVCPAEAIEQIPAAERRRLRAGVAEYAQERCVTETDGNSCGLCAERCPRKAIEMVKREGDRFARPVVDAARCVGCGKCEFYCPVKTGPKAIRVRGLAVQDFAFGADTLAAYFVDGSEWTSQARGVKPLLDALENGKAKFAGARCYDRIVGRAAAFLYAALGVKYVFAPVMSTPARLLLTRYGVTTRCLEETKEIRNRSGDGICPMDKSVLTLPDSELDEAVEAIRGAYAKMVAEAAGKEPAPAR